MSSRGLLPQLVDVLRALTDSQTLLVQRVRRACLEDEGGPLPSVEELSEPALDPSRTARSLVMTDPTPRDQGEQLPAASVQVTTPSALDFAALASHQGAGAATVTADGPEEFTPPPRTATTTTGFVVGPDANRNETSQHPAWPEPSRQGEPGHETATRDYNFFDELDAKLAGLPDTNLREAKGEAPDESAV